MLVQSINAYLFDWQAGACALAIASLASFVVSVPLTVLRANAGC